MNEPLVELTIESLGAGGDGVGRGPDGRVVFVPLAAPGDRLRVRLVEEKARFARGEIEAVLAPGPARVAPRCPVFGVCGGCAWQHLDYAAQVAAKREIVRDALARGAGLAELPPLAFTPSPAAYGYRGRARVRVERAGVGFRRRRSHELCAIAGCPLLAPPLDAALAELAAAPPRPRSPPGHQGGDWELALGEGGAVRVAPLASRSRPGAPREEPLVLRAGSERLHVSPGVFVQANALLLDALAEAVLDAAGTGATALELFAGAGFFTLGLARRFERVVAVESDPAATRDLARNVESLERREAPGPPNPLAARRVRVVEARVEAWLAAGEAEALGPEVVVLDPPRGGVGAAAAERLARLRARRVVHLSCDPATLARDLAVFAARGWRPAALHAFDLFPQTPHVEVLAVLEAPGASLPPFSTGTPP